MNVLLAGGAGFIGSHTAAELLLAGHGVFIIDNFSNSYRSGLDGPEKLSKKQIVFHEADLRDYQSVFRFTRDKRIDAIIHLAGYKSVEESISDPVTYFDNNLIPTINLCQLVEELKVKRFLFSSSATVYGNPLQMPIDESFSTASPLSPYAESKVFNEMILKSLQTSRKNMTVVSLRYFNPAGAHPSGLIGETSRRAASNLIPTLSKIAAGDQSELVIYGDNYDTPDGTCIRDFVHVVDLAKAHVAALEKIPSLSGWRAFNIGTGKGHSVKEVLRTYEQVVGRTLPYRIAPKRSGDAERLFTNPRLAQRELAWKASKTLRQICADAWAWESKRIA